MSRLIFNQLLIADIGNRKAKRISFLDGKNLLTSNANHLGKSLICKSLYYTLGAEVFFSEAWKNENSMYVLQFVLDSKVYNIARKNKLFIIWDNNGYKEKFYLVKNLQEKLNQIFNFHIMLIGKNESKSLIDSAPVFMYVPYYIDQEYGWTPETKSFNNLAQFDKEERRNALYYHVGCLDENYVNVSLSLDKAKDELLNLEKERKTCLEVISYMENMLENNGDIIVNETELTNKISDNRNKLNQILNEIEQHRNKIINFENECEKLSKEKETIEAFLGKKQKPVNQKSVQCPNCGNTIELNFTETFHKEYIKETIHAELADIDLKIQKLKEKIEVENNNFINASNQLKSLEQNITIDQNIYNRYIKMRSAKEMLTENRTHLGEIDAQIEKINQTVSNWQKLKKAYDESKKKADDIYRNNLLKLFAQLNVKTREIININEYRMGDDIPASGAYKARVILAKYYALLLTKQSFNKGIIDFPIVIDSPRGDEQDKDNAKTIMNFILKNSDINNQVIVATIDGDDYISSDIKPNIIELTNNPHELLTTDEYTQNLNLIENCLLNF
ncbi:MAG: hypothetical protein J6X43_07280 [Bacteroidales bacterium]|nr:hypothetical protein [Bacteroidales bacterium]